MMDGRLSILTKKQMLFKFENQNLGETHACNVKEAGKQRKNGGGGRVSTFYVHELS